jgi:uncharacterized Fe-S radical SAM superfamily protein PflX
MVIEEIDILFCNGTLDILVRGGVMPAHIYTWREIYHAYIQELNKTKSKLQAMENVAFEYSVSVELIYKIRRNFTKS